MPVKIYAARGTFGVVLQKPQIDTTQAQTVDEPALFGETFVSHFFLSFSQDNLKALTASACFSINFMISPILISSGSSIKPGITGGTLKWYLCMGTTDHPTV